MRDRLGRYQNQKPLTELAPPWACGCEHCEYGYVSAPALIGALTVAEQRAVGADEGLIVFCNCRAGHLNRQYLRKVHHGLLLEQKKNYRAVLLAALEPTIHYQVTA
jgi:hypothetical protein